MSDLIDRQAAIDEIHSRLDAAKKWYERVKDDDYLNGRSGSAVATFAECIMTLQRMPSAEPVRHWKFIGTEYDGYADGNPVYHEWKCSECGCIFEEDEPTYRYCPNCGAKMERLQESEVQK